MMRPAPRSALFPYTTLFRSGIVGQGGEVPRALVRPAFGQPGRLLSNVRIGVVERDRKSTRLNSSHVSISYAVFCLKKKKSTEPTILNMLTTYATDRPTYALP